MKHVPARRFLGITAITAMCAFAPATAAASTGAASTVAPVCAAPQLSQPFLSAGDSNWYTLAPGETPGAFDGNGWVLSDGAHVTTTTLADDSTRSVLDLPSGSRAVSPSMCVTSDYTTARTMVRNVAGSGDVSFYVSYGGGAASGPQHMGHVHGQPAGWTLSRSMNLTPAELPGWQRARFTLIAGGRTSEFQIYDFYVDPRMH